MRLISKFVPAVSALSLLMGSAAAAQDGFFTVAYRELSIDLTQLAGYGELKIEPSGYKKMGYGSCTVNFTRDEAGGITAMAPVVQESAATCPDDLAFTLEPGKKGMYQIKFTKGGDLAGDSFDLFPALLPWSDDFAVTAPAGFNILGMTIGQSRAEVEAILKAEGFERNEHASSKAEYTDGSTKAFDVWGKGEAEQRPDAQEDSIKIAYSLQIEGGMAEQVELIGREWWVPAAAKLSMTALKKSLTEKHGEGINSPFMAAFYNRKGEATPKAFEIPCDDSIHLQKVPAELRGGQSLNTYNLSPACGSAVEVMLTESFEAPGQASLLNLRLVKGDVAYRSFWESWSRGEEKALQERYELQSGMSATIAPKL